MSDPTLRRAASFAALIALLSPAAGSAQPTDAVPFGLSAVARDGDTGAPTLIAGRRAAPVGTPEQQARAHLAALAPAWGLSARDLGTATLERVSRTPRGGALAVFAQRVGGVPVHEARASLLLDARGDLLAAGGRLFPPPRAVTFTLDEEDAVRRALGHHSGRAVADLRLSVLGALPGGYVEIDLDPRARAAGHSMPHPTRVRRVLHPSGDRLRAAHYVELWTPTRASGSELWAYVISATDGAVLDRRSLTDHEAFEYTVFAEGAPTFAPWDSPLGDTTPNAEGAPVDALPPFLTPTAVAVEGLAEGPGGEADPWLPDGADQTRGNNVDAYADRAAPDGFNDGDLRARITEAGAFAHVYDPSRSPVADDTQQQAAITHLFYVNNWMHDWFYPLGFDEAAGNAQADNYGRGGMDGDRLLAQANDYSDRNNADMTTPADGRSPRMQMYVWDPPTESGVSAGDTTYGVAGASFGPTSFDVTAPLVLVDDGTAPTADACTNLTQDLTGRIALVDRGSCTFADKVLRAQAAGAVGVIVMNNRGRGVSTMGGSPAAPVTTPVLMVSRDAGATIRADELGEDARMFRIQDGLPLPSALDSQIVAHEWGHYMHRRLVPCGNRQCGAQSEGWGDFLALLPFMEEADDLDGAYPAAGFAIGRRGPIYFGIRRAPYSADPAINALRFRHIEDGVDLPIGEHPFAPRSSPNSEVHNAGEIWASMMFDALVALLRRSQEADAPYDFDEARRRIARYTIVGMQLSPPHPTYTEQRDAIILGAFESDPDDALLIAQAFAGRGAGSCAVSPARYSTVFGGVVEDYELHPVGHIEELVIEPAPIGRRCDDDALVDAGEDGVARVRVRNVGVMPLAGATLTVSADHAGVEAPAGDTIDVPELLLGEEAELEIPLRVDDGADVRGHVTFTATLGGVSDCTEPRSLRVAVDRDIGLREVEDFELEPAWPVERSLDGETTGVWSVGESNLGDPDWVLRGVDFSGITDTAAELPPIHGSDTEPVIVRFEHRFDFEGDEETLWDGGVIEFRVGTDRWRDVSELLDPGYTGPLTDEADNPLGLRPAYSRQNPSAPDADVVELDFGMAFAGQDVRLRFRIGTDQAAGAQGWEIDDLSITGSEPPVFPGPVEDAADCAQAPVADAGPDQTVGLGARVVLDGSGSRSPTGAPLDYAWDVLEGEVELTGADGPSARLTAPASPGRLTFRLFVTDGFASDVDTVDVVVTAGDLPPDAGAPSDAGPPGEDAGPPEPKGGGGCGCRAATPTAPAPALASLLLCLLAVRRMR